MPQLQQMIWALASEEPRLALFEYEERSRRDFIACRTIRHTFPQFCELRSRTLRNSGCRRRSATT